MPVLALLAAATFLTAFAIADVTGVRALGGLVLLGGGAWCAARMRPTAGTSRTATMVVLALAAFVIAHPLGRLIGAWPAVILAATFVGVATARLADSRR